MHYLKNKYFSRWAKQQGITDNILFDAIQEFEKGLFEANLGNYLFKKRIALSGRGKSGSTRSIIFYQKGKKLIFCFGFNKNQQENLSNSDSKLLDKLSEIYQVIAEDAIKQNIKEKEFSEIIRTEK